MGDAFLAGRNSYKGKAEKFVEGLRELKSAENFNVVIEKTEFLSGRFEGVDYTVQPSENKKMNKVGDYIELKVIYSNKLLAQEEYIRELEYNNQPAELLYKLLSLFHLITLGGSSSSMSVIARQTCTVDGIQVYSNEEELENLEGLEVVVCVPGVGAGKEVIYRCEYIANGLNGHKETYEFDGYNDIDVIFDREQTSCEISQYITWPAIFESIFGQST